MKDSHSKEDLDLELARARQIVQHMRADPDLIARMEKSDEVSQRDGQTAHGWVHALDVSQLTLQIADEVNRLVPGSFNEMDLLVAEASSLLHDSGRSVAVKGHEKHSAVIAHAYLLALAKRLFGDEAHCPKTFRIRVVQNACKHRASFWLYKNDEEKRGRRRELTDRALSAFLLGDKLCGSESRVADEKLRWLRRLAAVKLPSDWRSKHGLPADWSPARINWNFDQLADSQQEAQLIPEIRSLLQKQGLVVPDHVVLDQHTRINGAIKGRTISLTPDSEPSAGPIVGTFCYHLQVDERVAQRDLVLYMNWWTDAFHLAAKAAKHLGFRFQIDFNGHILHWDRAQRRWVCSRCFKA